MLLYQVFPTYTKKYRAYEEKYNTQNNQFFARVDWNT